MENNNEKLRGYYIPFFNGNKPMKLLQRLRNSSSEISDANHSINDSDLFNSKNNDSDLPFNSKGTNKFYYTRQDSYFVGYFKRIRPTLKPPGLFPEFIGSNFYIPKMDESSIPKPSSEYKENSTSNIHLTGEPISKVEIDKSKIQKMGKPETEVQKMGKPETEIQKMGKPETAIQKSSNKLDTKDKSWLDDENLLENSNEIEEPLASSEEEIDPQDEKDESDSDLERTEETIPKFVEVDLPEVEDLSILEDMESSENLVNNTPFNSLGTPFNNVSSIPGTPFNKNFFNRGIYGRIYQWIDKSRIRNINQNLPEKSTLRYVQNVNWKRFRPARAGVIVYTINKGVLTFGMGIDTKSGDITDFGGGVRYRKCRDSNAIVGALREFSEESLCVFGNYMPNQVQKCLTIYSSTMAIIFLHLNLNIEKANSLFDYRVSRVTNPEIKKLIWLTKDQLYSVLELGKGTEKGIPNTEKCIEKGIPNTEKGIEKGIPNLEFETEIQIKGISNTEKGIPNLEIIPPMYTRVKNLLTRANNFIRYL